MSIPLLIESIGPCESSWVRRRDFKRIRVQGLNGQGPLATIETSDGHKLSFYIDGEYTALVVGERIKLYHQDSYPISADLVA